MDEWESRACGTLHWYAPEHASWLCRRQEAHEVWTGWNTNGAGIHIAAWMPWQRVFDGSEAPFVRWFCGGLTNAAFNELDRHLLASHAEGSRLALIAESPNAPSAGISCHQLFVEAVLGAHVLREGLKLPHDARIAIYMPNRPEVCPRHAPRMHAPWPGSTAAQVYIRVVAQAVVWMAAAKRLGLAYVAVASGVVADVLGSRLRDTAAALVVTSCDLLHVVEEALAQVLAAGDASAAVLLVPLDSDAERLREPEPTPTFDEVVGTAELPPPNDQPAEAVGHSVREAAACVAYGTVEDRNAATQQGRWHTTCGHYRAADLMHLARRDLRAHQPSLQGPAVNGSGESEPGRESVQHGSLESRYARAQSGSSSSSLDEAGDMEAFTARELWSAAPPLPVEASHPLFILHTSGSTGTPKGIVHTHGGYQARSRPTPGMARPLQPLLSRHCR